MIHKLLAAAGGLTPSSQNVFGTIDAPKGVSDFDLAASANGGSGIGLIFFISSMIRVLTIGAGLFVFFNILSAGLMFISAQGDSSVPDKAKDRILYSVVGLAVIVFSYVIIGLISFIVFKDPMYILNPVIQGPSTSGAATP